MAGFINALFLMFVGFFIFSEAVEVSHFWIKFCLIKFASLYVYIYAVNDPLWYQKP